MKTQRDESALASFKKFESRDTLLDVVTNNAQERTTLRRVSR